MIRSLLGSAFALGWVAWIGSVLLTQMRGRAARQGIAENVVTIRYWIAALTVPILAFLASLPTRPPFSPGQGLGKGILLGAAGAWLAAWTLIRAAGDEAASLETGVEPISAAPFVAPFALAIVVAAVPLLWMRDVVADGLLGSAMGWLTATMLLLMGLRGHDLNGSNASDGSDCLDGRTGMTARLIGVGLAAGCGFVATVCALAGLGEYGGNVRFGGAPLPIPWSVVALPLAACVPFLLLLCGLPGRLLGALPGSSAVLRIFAPFVAHERARSVAPHMARLIVGGGLLLYVGAQFAHRLGTHPNLFRLLGLGWVALSLAWWLIADRLRVTQARASATVLTWQHLALPVMIVTAAGMVAYQMLAGVGIGMMLLGGWLVAGIALLGAAHTTAAEATCGAQDATGSTTLLSVQQLLRLTLFGTLLLLYRLFQVRFEDDLHNVLLPDHYALLGFIVGAATPASLSSYLQASESGMGAGEEGPARTAPSLLNLLAVGALTLFVPGVLVVLFGTKCALCLFFGLALACVVGDVARPAHREGGGAPSVLASMLWLLPGLLALAMALALAQWTDHVLPAAEMTRAAKIHLLTYSTGVVALLVLLANVAGRFRAFSKRSGGMSSSASVNAKGGQA